MRRRPDAAVALLLGVVLGCGREPASRTADPEHPLVSTLPQIALASFQNQARPGSLGDDGGARVGGFSDLYHDPRDGADVFWTVPDRGPVLDDPTGLVYSAPEFNPALVKLVAAPSGAAILQQIPILTSGGRPVTGLPNGPGGDPPPRGRDGALLSFDPNGLDPEGIVRVPDGTFWLAEEHGPSLVHLGRDGRVLERWLPRGRALSGADYPVAEVLPAALARREPDRGLESLAATGEGRFLYAMMEGPLVPADADGEPRPIRLLQVDTLLAQAVGEWVYLPEAPAGDPPAERAKVSALSFVSSGTLLAVETAATGARVYRLDLEGATNVLGATFDAATGTPLDALDTRGLAGARITPVTKSLVLDLARLNLGRIEGLAIVDADTIAVATDDGFGVSAPRTLLPLDAPGDSVPAPPAASQLVTIRLGAPLPLGR